MLSIDLLFSALTLAVCCYGLKLLRRLGGSAAFNLSELEFQRSQINAMKKRLDEYEQKTAEAREGLKSFHS